MSIKRYPRGRRRKSAENRVSLRRENAKKRKAPGIQKMKTEIFFDENQQLRIAAQANYGICGGDWQGLRNVLARFVAARADIPGDDRKGC